MAGCVDTEAVLDRIMDYVAEHSREIVAAHVVTGIPLDELIAGSARVAQTLPVKEKHDVESDSQ